MINTISDNFYRITLPMPFRLKHVHIYALIHKKAVALFDTGFNVNGSIEILENDLASIGQNIESIRDIFITHTHIDHCGMAGLIKAKSGASIHLSAIADQSNKDYQNYDLSSPKMKKFYLDHGLDIREVESVIKTAELMRNISDIVTGDHFVQPGETIDFGNSQLEVIFAPGHTRGHVCYYFRREGFLISGDTVLPQITPNLSPDLFAEDFRPLSSFLDSLSIVGNLSVRNVYPGHGCIMKDVKTRIKELYAHHDERTRLILHCLNGDPKTTYQISQIIFGSNLTDFDKFLAVNETYVHLQELRDKGLIREKHHGDLFRYTVK